MEPSIFAYIRKHSWRQQLVILGMTVLSFPPLYYSLELPKIIINRALSNPEARHVVFGYELDQVEFLFVLCSLFLGLVLISGAIKYILNVYAGIVAERMLRRLRYELYGHVLRFPLPHFRRVSQGELVQMINAETEALGGYVGDALAVPAFQGGTLLTILFFMFMQDPILGLAAIALYPFQAWIIPKLQRQVNRLGKQRVQQVRRNAERISETVAGVRDIRANDGTAYERARFSEQLGQVFWIRFAIYKKKFLIKFINNFLAQLGPFFFFSIGGYLVIQGQITLGALVAVVGAHKDLSSPWKELLTYYQTMYDVKIKYEQTVGQFAPAGLKPEKLQTDEPVDVPELAGGTLRAVNVTFLDEAGDALVDGASFTLDLPAHAAICGPAGSGKEELTLLLAGLLEPSSGRVVAGEREIARLPESVLGRRIGYVGNPSYVFAGTIEQNLLYGLVHRPVRERRVADAEQAAWARERHEAKRSGNSPYDPGADWVDYAAAGIEDPADRLPAIMQALEVALLAEEVYLLGLRGAAPDVEGTDLAARLLEARRAMHERLASDERLARLVEHFHPDRYNTNATLAENLLFGTPVGTTFDLEHLATNPYVLKTLEATGLLSELRLVGLRVAQTMLELFADLPPDHEYFRQFSFIAPEDLPDYRALVARADPANLGALSESDRARLLTLPFKLVVARHRLGLVSEELQRRIVEARRYFRRHLPASHAGAIHFFDPDRYNPASSIQDNILFGKVAYGQAGAAHRIAELLTELVDELGLRGRITEAGLCSPCGIGGGRLSPAQRQKLAIARTILKRPDVLILYDATGPLDPIEQTRVRDNILDACRGRTVIWAVQHEDWASRFEHVIVMEKGKVVAERSNAAPDRPAERETERLVAVS